MFDRYSKLLGQFANKQLTFPVTPNPAGAAKMAMLLQLEHSQWWSEEKLLTSQLKQISSLLQYLYKESPFYKQRIDDAGLDLSTQTLRYEDFQQLPILSRQNIQTAGKNFFTTNVPTNHGNLSEIKTSGSTGRAVEILGTSLSNFFWECCFIRDYLWHDEDLSKSLAAIRWADDKLGMFPGLKKPTWASAFKDCFPTGSGYFLHISTPIKTYP